MKLCIECGKDYQDDLLYCPRCGKLLEKLPKLTQQTKITDLHSKLGRVLPANDYPLLKFVAVLLILGGILVIVGGLFAGSSIYGALNVPARMPDDYPYSPIVASTSPLAFPGALIICLLTSMAGISMIANGELIMLMVNMQSDTSVLRQTIGMLASAISKE